MSEEVNNNNNMNDNKNSNNELMPVVFFSHGAGPCFFLNAPNSPFSDIDKNSAPTKFFGQFAKQQKLRPKAIVIFSAHWESDNEQVVVNTNEKHSLYFDYYGFPSESYEVEWPAPGNRSLALEVEQLLKNAGFKTATDPKRGLDHGVFVPLKLVFPDADIPVVQVSLLSTLDPAAHLRLGQAVASLRSKGVLIVGSGSASHGRASGNNLKSFVNWVTQTLNEDDSSSRNEKLLNFMKLAPAARENHPRTEHFIPLLVCAGASGEDKGKLVYDFFPSMGRISLTTYRFG